MTDATGTRSQGDAGQGARDCTYCGVPSQTFARTHDGPYRDGPGLRPTGVCTSCWAARTEIRLTADLWAEVRAHHRVERRTDCAQELPWLVRSFRRFRAGRIDEDDPRRDGHAHSRFTMLIGTDPLNWMPIGQDGEVNPESGAWAPRRGAIDGLHRLTVARRLKAPVLYVTRVTAPNGSDRRAW